MPSYQLATYRLDGIARAGLIVADRLYDAAAATGEAGDETVMGLLADWANGSRRLRMATEAATAGKLIALDRAKATLLAPLPAPGTIYCAGANYSDHADEMSRINNTPPEPDPRTLGLQSWHFIKSGHCVAGPDDEIELPKAAKKVDYEAELAVVIGRKGKDIPVAQALAYVAGYTVANDLSARDISRRQGVADGSPFKFDWVAHKVFDGACPLGPWITPAADIADPQNLPIQLSINGEMKQDSNTSSMIFSVADQIAHLSARITLWPGDIILTGTPAGVGNARGVFLKPGDSVTIRIGGIGELTNRMR